jgi:hypothetical protein
MEPDDVGNVQPGGQVLQVGRLLEPRAARPAQDSDHDVVAQLGALVQQVSGGPDEHVGCLEGLDPPDEQQQAGVRRKAQAAPGCKPPVRPAR